VTNCSTNPFLARVDSPEESHGRSIQNGLSEGGREKRGDALAHRERALCSSMSTFFPFSFFFPANIRDLFDRQTSLRDCVSPFLFRAIKRANGAQLSADALCRRASTFIDISTLHCSRHSGETHRPSCIKTSAAYKSRKRGAGNGDSRETPLFYPR